MAIKVEFGDEVVSVEGTRPRARRPGPTAAERILGGYAKYNAAGYSRRRTGPRAASGS